MLESLLKQIYKYRQIIRYIISGGTAALVNLVLLYVFTDFLKVWYLFSSVLAFCLAFFVSFFLQKYWTFSDWGKGKMYQQMGVYFAVSVANLGVNTGLLYLAVDKLKIWYLLAQVLVLAIIAIESFIIYKFLIFERPAGSAGVNPKSLAAPKVLIATGIYPPDYRGPATLLEALPRALEDKGFETKIITYSDIASLPTEKGKVYRILRRQPLGLAYLRYFWRLYRLAEWADVIYATDIYSVGYFAYLLKKMTGKKYIIRFAGDSAWETATTRGWTTDYIVDFQKKTYDPKIEKLKARRRKIMLAADQIIAVSHFIARVAQIIGVKEEKIKVIYNSIDFIKTEEIKTEAVGKIKADYGQDAKIIVTACQLTPWKGVAGIIKILPRLIQQLGKINLLVLGDGQEMERLKKLASELDLEKSVHFLGKVERAQTMNYFKAADLFILNSNYEALSHTLLEVMKAGTPIVASSIGGNPEVIEDGQDGLLVEYNNQGQLFGAAIKILTDAELTRVLTNNATEKLKKFNWGKTTEGTVSVLKEVIYG